MSGVSLILALLLDQRLGEVRRWHPLVGFGHLIGAVESLLYRNAQSPQARFIAGALGWIILVVPPVMALAWLASSLPGLLSFALGIVVLYFSLALRSLGEHARAVAEPLLRGDVGEARNKVAMIVSRDTGSLDTTSVARATVESALENGSDAVIAPIFWFLVAGAPGVLAHRLANTLDARWGYRNQRFEYFGRFAARADDLLNWPAARLCGLLYGLAGNLKQALQCWHRQGHQTASPNAGVVMAAGAGALEVRLGGPERYQGKLEWRPTLGCTRAVKVCDTTDDITRSVDLLRHATWLLIAAVLSGEITLALMGARLW